MEGRSFTSLRFLAVLLTVIGVCRLPIHSYATVMRPGKLDHFVVIAPAEVVAGEAFRVKIEARDAYGNIITDYNKIGKGINITPSGMGKLIPTSVSASSFTDGIATIDCTYDKTGTIIITAKEAEGMKYGNSDKLEVAPGSLDCFIVTAPSGVTAGIPFKVEIEARDAYNNTVVDYGKRSKGVDITTSGSVKISPETIERTSFINGLATVDLVYKKAEVITLRVKDSTGVESGASNVIRVEPGEANHFIVTMPDKAIAGEPFRVKIEARDAYGNIMTNYNKSGGGVDIILTRGHGKIIPTKVPPSSFIDGVATVDFTYDKAEVFDIIAKEGVIPKEGPEVRLGAEKESLECYRRAVEYSNKREYKKAWFELERAVKLDPKNLEAKKLLKKIKIIIRAIEEER